MANITKIHDHPSIIRSSNVQLCEGLRPHRIVLRDLGDQFVVHSETLDLSVEHDDDDKPIIVLRHESFDNGSYFNYRTCPKEEAKERAVECFYDRAPGRKTK